jgi:hypothetical protein
MFNTEKERCINCRMLDASRICSMKLIALPDSAAMRKAEIIDPLNQVCNSFEPANFMRSAKRKD